MMQFTDICVCKNRDKELDIFDIIVDFWKDFMLSYH